MKNTRKSRSFTKMFPRRKPVTAAAVYFAEGFYGEFEAAAFVCAWFSYDGHVEYGFFCPAFFDFDGEGVADGYA